MKKYLIIFTLLIAGGVLFGQRSAITEETAGTDSVKLKAATTIVLPSILNQEYDYSYQIIPTKIGSGDSIDAAVALWQSNDREGTSWTEITSARDTMTAATGILIEGTNATGMKHELILTGITLDSTKVIIYQTLKLDKEF